MFEFSAGTDRISVTGGGERDLTFTITRTGAPCPEAKIWLECESADASRSVSLLDRGGEPRDTLYRRFEPSEAQTFVVRIAPRNDAARLETTLKLVIADNAQIENSKKHSPAVTLLIEPAPVVDDDEKKSRLTWILQAVIAALTLVIAVGSCSVYRVYDSTKQVFPRIATGQIALGAVLSAAYSGHKLAFRYVDEASQGPGRVITVPHEEGDRVSTLFPVEIETTKVEVPDLVGRDWSKARKSIPWLRVTLVASPGSSRPRHQVLAMEPRPGALVRFGDDVKITLAGVVSEGMQAQPADMMGALVVKQVLGIDLMER